MYQLTADPTHSESAFTNRLIRPFLEMIANYLSQLDGLDVTYFPGEEPLLSMSKSSNERNKSLVYLADGIFRLSSFYDIELLLLEVSGPFLNTEVTKINFDHHKGMLGSLSMLKNLAAQFKFGDLDLFKKIKVYFIQGVYDFFDMWLDDTLVVKYDFEDKEEFLPQALNFYLALTNNLQVTLENIKALRESHKVNLKKEIQSLSSPPHPIRKTKHCTFDAK